MQPRFQVLLSGLGRTIGTLISTYTILGAPYYNYCTSIMGRQTLFEFIRAPRLQKLRVWGFRAAGFLIGSFSAFGPEPPKPLNEGIYPKSY